MSDVTKLRSLATELDVLIRREYLLSLSDIPPEFVLYTKPEEWEKNGEFFQTIMRRKENLTIEPATERKETESTHIQKITDGRTKDLEDPILYATGLAFSLQKMRMGVSATSSVKKVAQLLQDAVRMTKENFYAQLLNDADSASAPSEMIGFDGKPPISNAHVLLGGGTASNLHGSNSTVGYTILNTIVTNFVRTVDEKGNPHPIYRVNKLWVPIEEEANALEALKSRTRPDTTDRADSVIGDRTGQSLNMGSVMPLLYMTADRWFAVDDARHEIRRYTLDDGGLEGPIIDPLTKVYTWLQEFWIHRAIWAWRGMYMVPRV